MFTDVILLILNRQLSVQSLLGVSYVTAVTLPQREIILDILDHIYEIVSITGCSFKTNIFGTFYSHKKRKHHSDSLKDFKVGLVVCFDPAQHSDDPEGVGASCSDFLDPEVGTEFVSGSNHSTENLAELVEQNIAGILLKLEYIF